MTETHQPDPGPDPGLADGALLLPPETAAAWVLGYDTPDDPTTARLVLYRDADDTVGLSVPLDDDLTEALLDTLGAAGEPTNLDDELARLEAELGSLTPEPEPERGGKLDKAAQWLTDTTSHTVERVTELSGSSRVDSVLDRLSIKQLAIVGGSIALIALILFIVTQTR